MEPDRGVLEAARAIRPYLSELTGPAAARHDARLATLLADALAGHDVVGELRSVLEADDAMAAFLEEVLDDAPEFRPPDVQAGFGEARRNMQVPPGAIGPIADAGRHLCPRGDYVWYRRAVGAPVPLCPTHELGLLRA